MKISTKKDDTEDISTLRGDRITKSHIKFAMLLGGIILVLICTIILVFIFYGSDPEPYSSYLKKHLESMSNMH